MRVPFIIILSLFSIAQIGAQCLTINSILADACGNPEGANEMVGFQIGPQDIVVNDIEFDWPNNSFLDWCPEPTKTAQLNATIVSSCGFIIEPITGILPAGSEVVAISSTDFDVAANSFDGLSDTIYILYQCAGNTDGHFSNSASNTRTLEIEVSGSCNGGDNASYLGTNLVGGDGATILYDGNNANYTNFGCTAPYPILDPSWAIDTPICVDFGPISLNSLITGTQGGFWTGPNITNDTFNPAGLVGNQSISYSVTPGGSCTDTLSLTLSFAVTPVQQRMDTIYVCESYNFNGVILDTTSMIQVFAPSNLTYGCDTSIDRLVIIETVDYGVSPDEYVVFSGQEINFNIINEDAFLSYTWTNQFGENCNSNCDNSITTTNNNSIYIFTLSNTQNNCFNLDTIVVNVNYFSELNIPTTFTPNNDGQNDVFKIYGKDLSAINMKIYDRYGGVIFESSDINVGWDGMHNGKPVDSGAYLVRITASGKDAQQFDKTQQINLVR